MGTVVQVVQPQTYTPRARRRVRAPMHTFAVRQKPYQIVPFCLAPVLAGETLQNLLMQARVVTDPVKSPLVGWWHEQYWFYVKLADLSPNGEYQQMLVDPDYALGAGFKDEAASVDHYHSGGTGTAAVNWAKRCLEKVVDDYFRDGGELPTEYMINGYPAAAYNRESWMQSMSTDGLQVADDINVDINANATITASEVETAMRRWQFERAQGLTEMTYEDYLRAQGVGVKEEAIGKSELLRMATNWQYPSNTVEPTTGTPSSAVSWSIQERADKDRYFKEPGFIIGVSIARPKMYFSKQAGMLAGYMNDPFAWLPYQLKENAEASMRKFANTVPLLTGQTNAWWVDFKDLFMYGDQFINFSLADTAAGFVALPEASGQRKYPTATMVQDLFVDNAAKNLVRSDGVVSFKIASSVIDLTGPTVS